MISNKYAKANNSYLEEYNPTKPSSDMPTKTAQIFTERP